MVPPSHQPRLAAEPDRFRLGDWLVYPAEGILISRDRTARLEPRVMDVLIHLAARPGEVVAKGEILAAVWGGAFVEEGALAQAVHGLRKALGDDARNPRYVQTLPKRGYRLLAAVHADLEPYLVPPAWEPPPTAPGTSRPPRRSLLAGAWLLAGLAAAVPLGLLLRYRTPLHPTSQEKSAAAMTGTGTRVIVLPFENLGRPEDAYFADGLTEEITNDLASLPGLQVISRTSAKHYAEGHKALSEIGRDLHVSYLVEGTVRWAGGDGKPVRARITPQLIRVSDDAHVWTATYETDVKDIFEVQAEISVQVIDQLGITLLPSQTLALRKPPTRSLDAYRAYLRGLEIRNQPFFSEAHFQIAQHLFERAVQLDPSFASAWAELSQTHSFLAHGPDPSLERIEKARTALERALALDPDLPDVQLARAHFTYRCLHDYAAAQEQLEAALEIAPNHPEILETLGFVLRREGRLHEAIGLLERAYSLNPHATKLVWAVAATYRALRDHPRADGYYAQAIALAPDQPHYWEERALNRLAWSGRVSEARAVLAQSPIAGNPDLTWTAFRLDLCERRYREALGRLSHQVQELSEIDQQRLAVMAVFARQRLGDRAGALAEASVNREALANDVRRFPRSDFHHAFLAVTLAQLGRDQEALDQAEQAVRLGRADAFSGPRLVELQALVDTLLGRHHEAVAKLSRLLEIPYQEAITVTDLRLDPVWDPLRGEADFRALLERSGG